LKAREAPAAGEGGEGGEGDKDGGESEGGEEGQKWTLLEAPPGTRIRLRLMVSTYFQMKRRF